MKYRARDLLLLPGLLSLARIPLAVCFPLVVHRPLWALGLLLLAGLTDVLDGWVARRYDLVTETGAALDPVTDKLFVLTVVITLVASHKLTVGTILLLSTRELAELPLVVYCALHPRAGAEHPSANRPGKLATVLQFATVSWTVVGGPGRDYLIAATALAGVLAALSYWRRALRSPAGADRSTASTHPPQRYPKERHA